MKTLPKLLLLTTLLTLTTAGHTEPTQQEGAGGVVVIHSGDSSPPSREPSESVNQAVKRRAEQQTDGETSTHEVQHAPVYRTLGEAAAAGVGVKQSSVQDEPGGGEWTVMRILGLGLGVILGLGALLIGVAWWRSR